MGLWLGRLGGLTHLASLHRQNINTSGSDINTEGPQANIPITRVSNPANKLEKDGEDIDSVEATFS